MTITTAADASRFTAKRLRQGRGVLSRQRLGGI
jgi:hypothetical protein